MREPAKTLICSLRLWKKAMADRSSESPNEDTHTQVQRICQEKHRHLHTENDGRLKAETDSQLIKNGYST